MVITNLSEIISIIIVIIILGYIFSGYIKIYKEDFIKNFKFAILVTSPAVILHELGHKFAAIALGVSAYFKMWTFGLILGIVLRLFHSPFLLLAPGYVNISQTIPSYQLALVAFAGPFVNIVLWVGASLMLKKRRLKRRTLIALHLTKIINMWLFIFNMLPIPPLDGSKVFGYLLGFY
ncbi:MAG: M50 family metallopeptidase [Nanoarchaeota archaeon]|nr:M50 family metallopeptidase [Nanoarchaeota archaeon]